MHQQLLLNYKTESLIYGVTHNMTLHVAHEGWLLINATGDGY